MSNLKVGDKVTHININGSVGFIVSQYNNGWRVKWGDRTANDGCILQAHDKNLKRLFEPGDQVSYSSHGGNISSGVVKSVDSNGVVWVNYTDGDFQNEKLYTSEEYYYRLTNIENPETSIEEIQQDEEKIMESVDPLQLTNIQKSMNILRLMIDTKIDMGTPEEDILSILRSATSDILYLDND